MAEIIILPLVKAKQNELLLVLFDAKYFATDENAHSYVDEISNFIQTIPDLRHRPTKNKKYGAWYCEYKPNKRTSWFITFDKQGERYVVKNLINNHTKDYPAFIRSVIK